MAYRSRAHRHPAHSPHTRRPRARPAPAGRKGSDSLGWQQNEYVESWLNNAERNESCPAPKSGSRAPTDRSTALITSAPLLPAHPPRRVRDMPRRRTPARSRAISGRASRSISVDLAQSRGSTPRRSPPPHPAHRRAALSRAISERRSRGGTPAQKLSFSRLKRKFYYQTSLFC